MKPGPYAAPRTEIAPKAKAPSNFRNYMERWAWGLCALTALLFLVAANQDVPDNPYNEIGPGLLLVWLMIPVIGIGGLVLALLIRFLSPRVARAHR